MHVQAYVKCIEYPALPRLHPTLSSISGTYLLSLVANFDQ